MLYCTLCCVFVYFYFNPAFGLQLSLIKLSCSCRALSTISSYGSISICLSSIVTNKDKTWYVSFYVLLANSMTAFNNRQYRRFSSIFRVEYKVGNWPLTGSMSLVAIRKSGSYYRIRPSTRLTTLLVSNRVLYYYWKLAYVRRLDLHVLLLV